MEEVKKAVKVEVEPGKLLGYRAMHKKIREVHGLKVPRNLVYDTMADVNPEGLEARGGVGKPKRLKRNKVFTSNVSAIQFIPRQMHDMHTAQRIKMAVYIFKYENLLERI